MSHLPILVPGRPTPINVPCRLPDSFTFSAFLPSRGLREFTAWLTSTDPLKAEVEEVTLNGVEGDPRIPHAYELDEDEQRRADEAAADVLDEALKRLGLIPPTRTPNPASTHHLVLHSIATTYVAEEALFGETVRLSQHMRRLLPKTTAEKDVLKMAVLDDDKTPENSPSVYALAAYVEHALDAACLSQNAKAEAQRDAHASGDEDDAGSERVRAPRQLDAPTLKCLDVNY